MKDESLIEESKEFKTLKKRLVPPKERYSMGHVVITGQQSNWVKEQYRKRHESQEQAFKTFYLGDWPKEVNLMESTIEDILYFLDTEIVSLEDRDTKKLTEFLSANFIITKKEEDKQ